MGSLGDVDDLALWSRVRGGDAAAFGTLFDHHANSIYRYGYARTGDPSAAEEIVAIVFSEAWRQRHHIELLEGSLRPWLLTVARNQASRHHRHQQRQGRSTAREAPTDDHAQRVAEATDARGELRAVLRGLDELPETLRETLILRVWGELSLDQIAVHLGVSTGTVKSRLHRARARLSPHRTSAAVDRTVVALTDTEEPTDA